MTHTKGQTGGKMKKQLLVDTIDFGIPEARTTRTIVSERWYPKGREIKRIDFNYYGDGEPRNVCIYFYEKPFFDQNMVEKAIIPTWRAWLNRLMFWKYKEIAKGVFVS